MRAYRNVCEKIMKDWEVNPDGTLNFDMWHSTGETNISLYSQRV